MMHGLSEHENRLLERAERCRCEKAGHQLTEAEKYLLAEVWEIGMKHPQLIPSHPVFHLAHDVAAEMMSRR